jgi:hypothetical protein
MNRHDLLNAEAAAISLWLDQTVVGWAIQLLVGGLFLAWVGYFLYSLRGWQPSYPWVRRCWDGGLWLILLPLWFIAGLMALVWLRSLVQFLIRQ